MAGSKKNISKSIRISEEVFAYIDKSPGKGFNEKFENIILEAKQTEAERKKRLAGLERDINKAIHKREIILKQNEELERFFRTFLQIQRTMFDLKEHLQDVFAEPEEDKED